MNNGELRGLRDEMYYLVLFISVSLVHTISYFAERFMVAALCIICSNAMKCIILYYLYLLVLYPHYLILR